MRTLFRLPVCLIAALTLGACGGAPDEAEHVEEAAARGLEGVVVLDTAAVRNARIVVATVEAGSGSGLSATGAITYDANRVSHIGPRTAGRVVTLFADLGGAVGGGQPLAMLESAEVGQIRAELREAEALGRIAGENYQREVRLQDQGISSRREVLDAEADLRRAEAALLGARERLDALGAAQGTGSQFSLTAPFAGVVVERHASLGEAVGPEDALFTIADLSRVWFELDVYERDLSRIARGQRVDVIATAYPDRVFPGTIAYVGDIVDAQRRTVRARVEIPNVDRALRPGMFASASVAAGGGAATVVVPQDAIQQLDGKTVVFVPGSAPGEFRVREVEAGDPDEQGRVVILSGLTIGERVVVSGAFTLRSELSKAELADDDH